MKVIGFAVVAALSLNALHVQAAEDPAEVAAVIAAIKAANPDMKALCQQGPDGIRKAAGDAVRGLAMAGNIKGNPREVGAEAGQKVGQECRGG
jgi:hypothetical protein